MSAFNHFYSINGEDKWKYGKPYFLTRPKLLGCFENKEHEIGELTGLQYFKMPPKDMYPLDLNVPLDKYRFDPGEYFEKLLDNIAWFITKEARMGRNIFDEFDAVENVEKEPQVRVITHRGALCALMQTVHKVKGTKWVIRAMKYKGSLYLLEGIRDYPAKKKKPAHTHNWKLKKFCMVDHPNKQPLLINEKEDSYHTHSVYLSQFGNISLVYSCSFTGVISENPVKNIYDLEEMRKCRFVNLKTIYNDIKNYHLGHRYLTWWGGAYLENVNDIFVAYKNRKGLVRRKLQHLKTQDIPLKQKWKPDMCFRFVHTFINEVAEIMKNVDSKDTCYEFCLEDEINIMYRVHEGENEFSFLNKDYIEFMEANF